MRNRAPADDQLVYDLTQNAKGASPKGSAFMMLGACQGQSEQPWTAMLLIEPIVVHHLCPGGRKITAEQILGIVRGVNLGQSPQL